jgi:hypothetical protein
MNRVSDSICVYEQLRLFDVSMKRSGSSDGRQTTAATGGPGGARPSLDRTEGGCRS